MCLRSLIPSLLFFLRPSDAACGGATAAARACAHPTDQFAALIQIFHNEIVKDGLSHQTFFQFFFFFWFAAHFRDVILYLGETELTRRSATHVPTFIHQISPRILTYG